MPGSTSPLLRSTALCGASKVYSPVFSMFSSPLCCKACENKVREVSLSNRPARSFFVSACTTSAMDCIRPLAALISAIATFAPLIRVMVSFPDSVAAHIYSITRCSEQRLIVAQRQCTQTMSAGQHHAPCSIPEPVVGKIVMRHQIDPLQHERRVIRSQESKDSIRSQAVRLAGEFDHGPAGGKIEIVFDDIGDPVPVDRLRVAGVSSLLQPVRKAVSRKDARKIV